MNECCYVINKIKFKNNKIIKRIKTFGDYDLERESERERERKNGREKR